MPKFPVDAPKARVLRALEELGFQLVREGNHIAMVRDNADGTRTPLTMRIILTQSLISEAEFMKTQQNT